MRKFPIAGRWGGSGSSYIAGLIDHLYRPGMSAEETREFVAKCVAHAMSRDGYVIPPPIVVAQFGPQVVNSTLIPPKLSFPVKTVSKGALKR